MAFVFFSNRNIYVLLSHFFSPGKLFYILYDCISFFLSFFILKFLNATVTNDHRICGFRHCRFLSDSSGGHQSEMDLLGSNRGVGRAIFFLEVARIP